MVLLDTIRDYAQIVAAAATYFYARIFSRTMNPALTDIEPSTQLSETVWRILGANPSPFTLQGTNTYLVGSGPSRILIDTGEKNKPAYISELRDVLKDNKISAIICTHWHDDHVGGIKDVKDKISGNDIPVYKFKNPNGREDDSVYKYIEDGAIIKVPGTTLRVIASPGHTMDHISLYFEEEGSLFCGDCILGEGTTIFEDLYTYMQSLQRLLDTKPSRIYSGHGPVIENGIEKINEYITHRNRREEQILSALSGDKTLSAMEITNVVYPTLSWSMKLGALNNVNQHLTKLIKEKKVIKTGRGYQIIN
uniref:Beta-lactamase-like protein 2 homolog n=1 Tax=Syphacia muris TaxID=451379 RepID=A0A0N5AMR1_9BILA